MREPQAVLTRLASLAALLVPPVALVAQSPIGASPRLLAAAHVRSATVQRLRATELGATLTFTVELGDSGPLAVIVHRHDIRAAGFSAWVATSNGTHELAATPPITWRGAVPEWPGSHARVGYWDGGVRAMVWPDAVAGAWAIEPVRTFDPAAAADEHLVYRCSDVLSDGGSCGNQEHAEADPGSPETGVDAVRVCEIAIECDRDFMARFGNDTTAAHNDVTNVINLVEGIYDRDAGIRYAITRIVFSIGSDAYGAASTIGASTLLGQFRSHWRASHASIPRDVAHLFSGRDFSGSTIGIAYVGVICNSSSYATSEHRGGRSLSGRVGLVAHELGHNWNAGHCNSSSPNDCRIMCSTINACSRDVSRFGQASINTIVAYKNTRGCIHALVPAPILTAVTPSTVSVLSPEELTLTGANLSPVTSVTTLPAGTAPSSEFTFHSDSTIRFVPSGSSALGRSYLWVTGAGGSSNVLSFDYVPTDPPKLVAPVVATTGPGAVEPWQLRFGGAPHDRWALFMALDTPQMFPILGIDFLVNGVQLLTGTLDAAGLGSWAADLPATFGSRSLFTQVVTLDANMTSLDATNVGATLVLF